MSLGATESGSPVGKVNDSWICYLDLSGSSGMANGNTGSGMIMELELKLSDRKENTFLMCQFLVFILKCAKALLTKQTEFYWLVRKQICTFSSCPFKSFEYNKYMPLEGCFPPMGPTVL